MAVWIVSGLLLLSCAASADQGVPAVPETQSILTTTGSVVHGLVTETDALSWTLTNQSLADIPPLEMNQVVYTTAYDASLVAQAGQTTFLKSVAIDTRNKVPTQSNVKADTLVTFAPTGDGGGLAGAENLLIDGTADLTEDAQDSILCPFVSASGNVIPAYCNIVQAGGSYELTIGSVTTSADDRFVSSDATNPVVLNYAIHIKPYDTTQGAIPATGSAMSYMKAHIQEARGYDHNLPDEGMNKSEDLAYSTNSHVQGTITTFSGQYGYSSQVTSLADYMELG